MTTLVRSCSGQNGLIARTVFKSCHLACLIHSGRDRKALRIESSTAARFCVQLHGTHLTRVCETFTREPRTHLFSIIIICLPFSFLSRTNASVPVKYDGGDDPRSGFRAVQQQPRPTEEWGHENQSIFASFPIDSDFTVIRFVLAVPCTGLITLAHCYCIRHLALMGSIKMAKTTNAHGETCCTVSRVSLAFRLCFGASFRGQFVAVGTSETGTDGPTGMDDDKNVNLSVIDCAHANNNRPSQIF